MNDLLTAFVEAACVPLDRSHASGTLDAARAILAAYPRIAEHAVHAAAILGDEVAVARFLSIDAASATRKGGPRGWDALTHLCFSRYLRLDRSRAGGFLRSAEALLDAGASARTGFRANGEFESALYGAAGIAHDPGLTRLLLDRGADPNDGEVVYHTPEGHDNAALGVLVDSGKLDADSLATMLLRKHDWHDRDGIAFLLERGADPDRPTRWGYAALHQAIRRDNDLRIVELLLDHGADPERVAHGRSAIAMAARDGRGDLLELFERRGVSVDLDGAERLLAACARDDSAAVASTASGDPAAVREILADGGSRLVEFAGVGNTAGVRHLLDLGVSVTAVDAEGDPYWDIAQHSSALHVAAWRAQHETLRLLIARGAPVDARDGRGNTPLVLAVRACVDSHWKHRRSPESVAALLAAGASAEGVDVPTGYADVDRLLSRRENA
jgi:hypothetical protein